MAKKKKKKKKDKDNSLLSYIDESIDSTYDSLQKEIEMYQLQLLEADQKARKKARKKIRKDPNYFATSKERIEARNAVIKKIENGNLLERLEEYFKLLTPLMLVLSRLVATFIVLILGVKPVVLRMKPETLTKLNNIYQTCMSVC